MRLALAQINTVVGDLDGNRTGSSRAREARAAGADLVLFPELAVTGYPPEDLLLRPGFVRAARRSRRRDRRSDARDRRARRRAPPRRRPLQRLLRPRRRRGPRASTASASCRTTASSTRTATSRPAATCSCSASATCSSGRRSARTSGSPARPRPTSRSPARSCREHLRLAVPRRQGPRARGDARVRARDNACFVALCNAVGGQDELIFDGHSVVLDDEGELVARAPGFEEALLVVDVDPIAAVGRRLRDVRRRALARDRATRPRSTCSSSPRRARRPRLLQPRAGAAARTTSSRCAWRSSSACATTSRRTASATS